MKFDDIVYLCLLFFSIAIGYIYRPIQNIERKKQFGTAIGLVLVLAVSGVHILYNFIFVLINAFIILNVDRRKCHLISFTFSFLYLLFFRTTIYFGIPYPPAHTNLIQMILTLKLVGLAFEVNKSHILQHKENVDKRTLEEQAEQENAVINLTFVDIIHYSFNYVGVLTGPYFKYKTFDDSFKFLFHKYSDWKKTTLEKLKYIPFYAVLFLWATYNWPLSYALTDEFYTERSWLYRYWYIWPNFFIFRMRIYTGLVLSECVCTMAGLGAYPVVTEPKAGMGPSKNFKEIATIANDPDRMEQSKYNYETIHNINPYGADFCVTCREGMKHWNMCVQYWLAVYVYKQIPFKQFRTAITMFVSAVWHGVYMGYYICICSVPIYLVVEDLYVKLFIKNNRGLSLKIWEWIIWFLKMQFFSYFAIAFHLLEVHKVIHYYNSIYHVGWIFAAILYAYGLLILKMRKNSVQEEGGHNLKLKAG